MKSSSFRVFVALTLTLFLFGSPFNFVSDSTHSATHQFDPANQSTSEGKDASSVIDEEFISYKLEDELDSFTSLIEIPEETRDSARQYHVAPSSYGANPLVDFSPLFIALIPICLFLGAAAAFALSVATSTSTAVATAQQQQQQEENNNNNNAASSNNNNNALLATLLATFTNNQASRQPTFIIVTNATALANFSNFFPFFLGRSMKSHVDWSQSIGRWWRQRRRQRRHRRKSPK